MEFLENHKDLLIKVLDDGDERQEEGDFDRFEEKERQESRLPPDASLVESFEDFVENWTDWTLEADFYVCKVGDKKDTFVLIQLDWDDNWGRWDWSACAAAQNAPSRKVATRALLKRFAEDNLESAGEGEWEQFLKRLIEENSQQS